MPTAAPNGGFGVWWLFPPSPALAGNACCSAARMRTSGVTSVATLHLMVGLPCSGKTTLAQRLETEKSALRLTPDEWQVPLFGQDAEEPEHDARHTLIETMLWNIASRALALGTNVILDFGFWAREEREDFRLRAKLLGASSEVHFLDVSDDELMRRLAVRNSQLSQESFYIPEDMMKPWIAFFQRPTPDELERRE
jgi:predicted kinase